MIRARPAAVGCRFSLQFLPAVSIATAIAGRLLAAEGTRDDATTTRPAKEVHADSSAAAALAARIDALLAERWAAEKVEPAPPADDAEYLRRVYLDLAGQIPSVGEARAFLADNDSEKRRKLVDHLLARASFSAHFGRTLGDLMMPGAKNNLQVRGQVPFFEDWLRMRLSADTPYDKLVSEVLTFAAAGPMNVRGNTNLNQATPAAFYLFNEQKPENLAASTARLFLGVNIECAQCHNHPFAKWKREDFWSLAAFFGTSDPRQRQNAPAADGTVQRGIQIPGTSTTVPPRLLDGSTPNFENGETPQTRLARWITSPDNAYFARTAANRLWAHFFGRGIVDPVDDFDDEANPPSHPAVLDELARQFVYHDFDLKYLVRAITATRAYQLSSLATHPSQDETIARLDTNADGRISADELKNAETALRQRDYDDDELVTAQELSPDQNRAGAFLVDAPVRAVSTEASSLVFPVRPTTKPDELAAAILGRYDRDKDGSIAVAGTAAIEFRLTGDAVAELDRNFDGVLDREELGRITAIHPAAEFHCSVGPGAALLLNSAGSTQDATARRLTDARPGAREAALGYIVNAGDTMLDFRVSGGEVPASTRQFAVAQFPAFDGDKNGYIDEVEAKTARSPLVVSQFKVMDRDGDGRVFKQEYEGYFDRQQQAAATRLSLEVTDDGPQLFEMLDKNRDGRLTTRELRAAPSLLDQADANRDGMIAGSEIPRSIQLELKRGTEAFDPLGRRVVFASGFTPPPRPPAVPSGPVWFHKMDRNADGDLSPREFLGSREDFDRLDANRDGLIELREAESRAK